MVGHKSSWLAKAGRSLFLLTVTVTIIISDSSPIHHHHYDGPL
jgi:hypothetical protein